MMNIILALFPLITASALDLNQAYQREYVYLISQKEALLQQKSAVKKEFGARSQKLQQEIRQLQQDLTRITHQNDERHEALAQLEKRKRELDKRESSIESTFKRASQSLAALEKNMVFESTKAAFENPARLLKLADLNPLFQRAHQTLRDSAQAKSFSGHYLDEKEILKAGEVTRLGRVAAFVNENGVRKILGPNGTGMLKVLDSAASGEVYLFENLNEIAKLQRQRGWLETAADLGPAVFLAMVLCLVAGLFMVMVRM